MIAMLREAWDAFVYILGTSPNGVWPLFWALITSASVTQTVKFWIDPALPKQKRALIAQSVAFLTALAVVALTWPTRYGAIAGVCAGIWSPTIWAICMRLIRLRWPAIADLLSMDTPRSES